MFHPVEELTSVLHHLAALFAGILLLFHSLKYAHVVLHVQNVIAIYLSGIKISFFRNTDQERLDVSIKHSPLI